MSSYKPTSLLPKHKSEIEKAHDIKNSLMIDRLNMELQKIPTLFQAQYAPVDFLDSLAYATSNDIYFLVQNLDENSKRKLLNAWIFVHRKKGTNWAIKKLFEALDVNVEIEEWMLYNGTPYRFRININQLKNITKEDIKIFFYGAKEYGNVKSILEYLNIKVEMLTTHKISTATIRTLPKQFYKRDITEYLFYKSAMVSALPKYNFIQKKLGSKIFHASATIANIPSNNSIIKSLKSNLKIKGAVICQL